MRAPVRLGAAENTLIAQLNEAGARDEAERLGLSGLPTRRVEAYHYTDLKLLLRAVPPLAAGAGEALTPPVDIPGAFRLSIVNGRPHIAGEVPKGVIVGIAEGAALTERDDVLVRLNSALARETLTLTIEGDVGPVIHIDRQTTGVAAHAPSSVRLFLADGARATILETYATSDAAHVANHGGFVQLGRGATLTHVTVDRSARPSAHLATTEYEIGGEAKLRTLTVHAGAGLERAQIFARMGGEGAHADFTGLNLTDGGQHADITLEVRHAKGHCSCKPLYKQIARGRSKAVFQGKIVVERDAQKTDAKLMMQGLMLSDEAEILSKPELEIFADDVVCGHGSTCGRLDEDWLFYLTSRGIPQREAETMLVRGFIAELLDPIEDEGLNAALQGVVDGWLAGK
ncbi:MAG TPA: Fe-S cluster assembly protein SufD [Devosiaceae bacterium]|jgi:Fe-S cluster assembly protein SufD|nr:Fe-S cluster assembly protein SufD [Devosiaceae bacterium]